MKRTWSLPIVLAVCGLAVAVLRFAAGRIAMGVAFALVFLVLAAAHSPLVFPASVTHAEARRRSEADGRPIVYWRAGCRYCLRLRLRLGRDARRAHWVDIWSDPDGAATVRAATGGDETVPTVVVSGQAHVNPDPGWVRGSFPDLLS